MIDLFFAWLGSLGWGASLCFALAVGIVCCIVILLVDWAWRRHNDRRELAAIKARNWEQRKEKLANLIEEQRQREKHEADDAEFMRRLNIDIVNDDSQRNREQRQFHIPAAFRDMKGTQR